MTQQSTVHVYSSAKAAGPPGLGAPAPAGCNPFGIATGIASNFSNFDVSQTGTNMPCYCVQWGVSDKVSGAKFTAAFMELRTSHDPLTAAANHFLYYNLRDKAGNMPIDRSTVVSELISTANFNHPLGTRFEDTIAFYLATFPDPADNPALWTKLVTFFWYNFVNQGDKAQIIATGQCTLPGWFQATDLCMEFVAIKGNVTFAKELHADIELGEQSGTGGVTTSAAMALLQSDGTIKCDSPCVTQFGTQTSNAQQTLLSVSNHSSATSVHI